MTSVIFLSACSTEKITQTTDQQKNIQQNSTQNEDPNRTTISNKTYSDGTKETIKEIFKDGKLMQRDISRTFPDGKTENFVEQVIENSDKSVQIKRTYENGTIENIKTERPSETTKIETISIKKPDGH